jgi:asparagine synthase (glutamine-hydrolysing)
MCGIAGVCSSRTAKIDRQALADMIAMVHHRGPDESGLYLGHSVGLASARLSIIDLSGGHQPLHNEDKSLWITFNGEIFNYLELRQELLKRGHRFTTQSDTEVIVHLYEEEGEDCVRHLNGQWAFAIWDSRERRLFLSRDRLGVRPLFYTLVNGDLIFGSEIKSLFAHPEVPREIDLIGLDQIFTFWCTLPPRTIFSGVRTLPPGHSLVFESGSVSVRPYWQPDFRAVGGYDRTEAACVEELEDLLVDAVRIRLRSDVPVGAYLSGGLDSTIITAIIKRFSDARLRTFSIGFATPDLDESEFQRQAIEHLDTDHESISCSPNDVAEVFPDVIWHTETPIVRAAPAPLQLLSRLVRNRGYKVVLTGEGSDEVFGGYDIYKEAKVRRFVAAQAASSRRALLLRRLYPYQRNLQMQPEAWLRSFFQVKSEDLASPFFSHLPRWHLTSRLKMFFSQPTADAIGAYDGVAELATQLPVSYPEWTPFGQAQYLETMFLLPGYILSSQGDRVALANSVEARHPFLDYRVIEFAAALPPQLKMKVLNEKYILKRAFGHLLPPSIVARPKQPYRAPDGKSFFGGHADDYVLELLSPARVADDGIFSAPAVNKLVEKFREGRALGVKDDMALVGILSTQLVLERFIHHFPARSRPNLEPELACAEA